MNPTLQRDLVNFLRPLPQFESENSRKALLITAGLSNIVSSIELCGSADEFVPLLVRRLEAFGDMADGEPALVVLLRSLAQSLGQEKNAAIRKFCARLLDDEPARLMARCPYRGLSAFREEDEQYFFGRDAYAAKLVEAVQQSPFVAVIGASGSGKSSLVFAGLIPQLRRQLPSSEGLHELPSWEGLGVGTWQIATLRPLTNPFYEMASALFPMLDPEANEIETMRQIEQLTAALQAAEITLAGIVRRIARKSSASRLLIAIDQFEELYAPENAATCRTIIEQLSQLIADTSLPVSVVITLRSDFLGQANSQPDFSHLIADNNLLVPAMNADELRAAIAEPAQKAGQPLSAEVVDLLIEQTKKREGALPLLEFALTQIWQGMAQGVEPAETLKQIGGVGGALANKAKELFDSLTPAEQQIARRAFLAMTRLGEGTNDTRRRTALAEMVSHQDAPDNVRNMLRLFAQPGARLLTLAEDTAEITHEALFEHWDALKQWIDGNRDDLRFLRQVNDAAQHWDAQGRPDGSLWRSPNLDLLQAFHTRAAVEMTALQVTFFQESERKEKQTRFWKRMTWAVSLLLTTVSIIGAIWAMRSERIVQQEKEKAKKEIDKNTILISQFVNLVNNHLSTINHLVLTDLNPTAKSNIIDEIQILAIEKISFIDISDNTYLNLTLIIDNSSGKQLLLSDYDFNFYIGGVSTENLEFFQEIVKPSLRLLGTDSNTEDKLLEVGINQTLFRIKIGKISEKFEKILLLIQTIATPSKTPIILVEGKFDLGIKSTKGWSYSEAIRIEWHFNPKIQSIFDTKNQP